MRALTFVLKLISNVVVKRKGSHKIHSEDCTRKSLECIEVKPCVSVNRVQDRTLGSFWQVFTKKQYFFYRNSNGTSGRGSSEQKA